MDPFLREVDGEPYEYLFNRAAFAGMTPIRHYKTTPPNNTLVSV
jgi:hypothetical protein